MTPGEIKTARFALGVTIGQFAAALNVERRTVERYEDGSRPVPGSITRLITVLLRSAQAREICGLKAYPAPRLGD